MSEEAERARLFSLMNRGRALLSVDLPLEDRRRTMSKAQVALAADVTVMSIEVAGSAAEWISTPDAGECVIFYVHGGGLTLGGLNDSREFLSRVARAVRAEIFHPDYRLAPEHPFPAALADLRAAYDWLDGRRGARRLFIVGDSAGGGLALSLVMALRDDGAGLPDGLVLISPWADLAMSGQSYTERADRDPVEDNRFLRWCADAYAAGASVDDWRVSPIRGEFGRLPPMMVLVGTEEVMYDDAIGIAQRARASGVRVELDVAEGMPHVYPRFAAILREGQRAIERIARFIDGERGLAATPPAPWEG